jgi:MFS transporter, ACS family, glucarate transporter
LNHSGQRRLGRIRWRIFALMFGFGFVAYLQQKSITVAAVPIMPELGFTQLQIGWLEQAYANGYAVFMIPAAILAQRFGARGTLVVMGLIAFVAMLGTPLAPSLLGGTALFALLLGLQFTLGIAQAPTFPVSAGVFETWFPANQWALAVGLQTMGLQLGAAVTPPLIATLMHFYGWRNAIVWTTIPALGLIGCWAWYGRDTPREHASVSGEELAEVGHHPGSRVNAQISLNRVVHVLANRNVVLLTLSYLSMNYAFYLLSNWAFVYLVQERHFSVLESGWLSGLPPLAAAMGAGIGGMLTGWACSRYGSRHGLRAVPLIALPAGAALLLLAAVSANAYLAVAALALCFGSIELTEGAFWAAAMAVGGSDTMAATSCMNTGGTLGGIIGIPVVAYLSGHHQWGAAFLVGAALTLVSALVWLAIDVADPLQNEHAPAPVESGAAVIRAL